jgi:hypothetical protein
MIAAALALVAVQAAPPQSGLALFRSVCVDRTVAVDQVRGSPIKFAAMPAAARAALARANNAYETLDADGGRFRAVALPGGDHYLILPALNIDVDELPAPGCIVLWKKSDLTAARSYIPPYEAQVALQRTEGDGWIMMRAIPSSRVPAPPK